MARKRTPEPVAIATPEPIDPTVELVRIHMGMRRLAAQLGGPQNQVARAILIVLAGDAA